MLLRHLRYLLAVADHGNFTRAAQALHVSQPTLSQQIKQLEASLGAELLDRSARSVQPTDAGAAYIEYARRVLRELEAGKRAIHDVKDLSRGTLRLGMTPTFMAYLVGPLLRDFLALYPKVQFEVFELSMIDIEARLADDTLDIAIAFAEGGNPDIQHVPLYVEKLGLAVGRDHRLFNRTEPLSLAELERVPLALLTPEFVTRTCIDDYYTSHGIIPLVIVEANSVNAILEIVRHTGIATILPEATALQDPTLRKIEWVQAPPQRTAALLRRKNGYQSTMSMEFEKLVKAKLSDTRSKPL
ncbi:transcriptional regulator CynR [Pseudomonas sp. CCI4.2]|uniref:transcriptional regulator CynR n=1 Tax=Pseudomonas sp. CCI4.2 TaxID=3048620 RepID=UPI002AC9AF6C|nr:transcriptional regulator CynR [Pseudomonas sp. CCI4.2]MEB0090253.1 transcriptional regulator CynR [Pseudomonas sp. CCI4.2]WPX51977.1 transcriptional regulator CynR [Pseudomonas sp. CCI4.2]